jgi:hypothetical protein
MRIVDNMYSRSAKEYMKFITAGRLYAKIYLIMAVFNVSQQEGEWFMGFDDTFSMGPFLLR